MDTRSHAAATKQNHNKVTTPRAIQGCTITHGGSPRTLEEKLQHSATQSLALSCRPPSCADGYADEDSQRMTRHGLG